MIGLSHILAGSQNLTNDTAIDERSQLLGLS